MPSLSTAEAGPPMTSSPPSRHTLFRRCAAGPRTAGEQDAGAAGVRGDAASVVLCMPLQGAVSSLPSWPASARLSAACASFSPIPQPSSPIPAAGSQLEKFLCLGDDRHIVQVWVQGRPVKNV